MISRRPLVLGKKTYADITNDICEPVEAPIQKTWLAMFAATGVWFLFYLSVIAVILTVGTGVMGINHPVGWGTMIVTFVFWIGIGHAGTLISAILFLFRQKWRTGIARSAEAMFRGNPVHADAHSCRSEFTGLTPTAFKVR